MLSGVIALKNNHYYYYYCTRGHSCRLFVPFCKNHVYASSFLPRTSKDWNNLTFDPSDAPSLYIFTRKLRDDNALISFFLFYFFLYVMFCFVLTSPPLLLRVYVVVVDPTPPTCCQQSPAPESCGSQQSLPPGGKERLHFVGIRPEVQARKGGW